MRNVTVHRLNQDSTLETRNSTLHNTQNEDNVLCIFWSIVHLLCCASKVFEDFLREGGGLNICLDIYLTFRNNQNPILSKNRTKVIQDINDNLQ